METCLVVIQQGKDTVTDMLKILVYFVTPLGPISRPLVCRLNTM